MPKSALSMRLRNLSFYEVRDGDCGCARIWQNLRLTQPPLQFCALKRRLPFIIFVLVLLIVAARRAHRLDVETKTFAARWALFFSSRRAGGAVVPPVR